MSDATRQAPAPTDTPARREGGLTTAELADALVWIQAARVSAARDLPYLETALAAMVPVAVPGLGTVACDRRWRFYYDPARAISLGRSGRIGLIVSDLVHELGHLLRDHAQRWDDMAQPPARHRIWNVAADAHVNQDLIDLSLAMQASDVTFASFPADLAIDRQLTTEEIYLRLAGDGGSSDRSSDGAVPSPGHVDCGSGSGGSARAWELPDDHPFDGSVPAGHGDLIRELTAQSIRSAAREIGTGHMATGLAAWANDFLEPSVDWRRELRSVVTRALEHRAGRRDYSWQRPPRRRIEGFITPGMVAPEPPSVAVVVDTSGSMSADELGQCITDVAALARAAGGGPRGIRVIPCDTSVADVITVRSAAHAPRMALTGGGGTDLRVGVRAATELTPRPHVVVTLTDGFTAWDDHRPDDRITYICVIVGPGVEAALPLTPPWARVIHAPSPEVGA